MSDPSMYTYPVALANLKGVHGTDTGALLVGSSIATLPMLLDNGVRLASAHRRADSRRAQRPVASTRLFQKDRDRAPSFNVPSSWSPTALAVLVACQAHPPAAPAATPDRRHATPPTQLTATPAPPAGTHPAAIR